MILSTKKVFVGVVLCMFLAGCSIFISGVWSLPVMAVALILGIAGSHFFKHPNYTPGIRFSASKILRLGIILLGVKVTISDLNRLGIYPFLLVIICILFTIGGGILLAKFFKYKTAAGILAGVSIAICGASAALATSASLNTFKNKDNLTIITVIAVTTLSTAAMLLYPVLFYSLPFLDFLTLTRDDIIAILIGTSIHDVAQVVGAGYNISDKVGAIATYTKLLRVSFLPFVILLVAFYSMCSETKHNESGEKVMKKTHFFKQVPWFAFGFLAVLLLNSTGIIPADLRRAMDFSSKFFLVTSIIGIGLKTCLGELFKGYASFLWLMLIDTLWLLFISIAGAYFLF